MPNIKSAKKRVKVTETKTLRNKMVKSNLKTTVKHARQELEASSQDMQNAVKEAVKKADMAASKGVIHKNKAARIKSGLQKKLNVKP